MLSFYVVIEMYNRVSQKNRAVAFLLISPLNPVSVGIDKTNFYKVELYSVKVRDKGQVRDQ